MEWRRLWGGLIAAFQYVKGAYKKDRERLLTEACHARTRGSGFKQKEDRIRLGMRKKFFIVRVMRHWSRLSREVVDTPCLEVFRARWDGALSNLV